MQTKMRWLKDWKNWLNCKEDGTQASTLPKTSMNWGTNLTKLRFKFKDSIIRITSKKRVKSRNRSQTLTQSTKRASLLSIENLRNSFKLKERNLLKLNVHSQTVEAQLGKNLHTAVAPVFTPTSFILQLRMTKSSCCRSRLMNKNKPYSL